MVEEKVNTGMSDDSKNYLKVHRRRYDYLLGIVREIRSSFEDHTVRILDIGPSFFTRLLEENFPEDMILMLGLEYPESRGGHLPQDFNLNAERFFHFNLNDAQFPAKWIKILPSRIAIMAEVIEHLHTSPTLVLQFLRTCISDGGYLILQTPNAASLKNRISMLAGKNPFEMIRENQDNPGHFREYTMNELIMLARSNGFEIIKYAYKSYFNPRNSIEKIYIAVTNILPKSFRNGLTLVLRKK